MTDPEAEPQEEAQPPRPTMPSHHVDRPELLETVRLWPIVDPDLSDADVKQLRRALRGGAFTRTAKGPGSSNALQEPNVLLTAAGLGAAAVAIAAFVTAGQVSGWWTILFIVLGAAAALPALWLAGVGAVFAWRVQNRRGRLIRRLLGRFLLPRHFGREYASLVERAALATEAITLDSHPGLGADDAFFRQQLWRTAEQARLAWKLRLKLSPVRDGGDEVVAEVLARATEAVDQIEHVVTEDVERLEKMAALLAEVGAAQAAVNRLDGIRVRTAEIAQMIAEARGDQPDLAGEVLQTRTDEARKRYEEALSHARSFRGAWPD